MSQPVTIIGAGLAGTEAAHQLARRGIAVRLFEMRPNVDTDVHKTSDFAELVCSNSLRSDDPFHPVGLIKREMAGWDSLVIRAARASSVPAGSALAVDRERFSQVITEAMNENPLIEIVREEVAAIPDGPTILAAGPLCSDALSKDLYRFVGDDALYFYDAIAPVVEYDSLNLDVVFFQSRYNKGGGADYLNIPLDEEAYLEFHRSVVTGERVVPKKHEKMIFFEGCLPIEVMADRGVDTLRFGPMKPVGLVDPRTGRQPYAVIQLRQDNFARSHWNLVGFQTQLKWGEQKRILSALPGMEKARFVRYGMIHRNTYVDSSKHLKPTLQFRKRHDLFLAGQISGVEGYVESAASGLMAAIQMSRFLARKPMVPFPATTAMGALAHYVSFEGHDKLNPVNINFGIMAPLVHNRRMKKKERRLEYVRRAVRDMNTFAAEMEQQPFEMPDYETVKQAG
ncbi:methylenetetrahydrofolate--tRNA-(uracil(54)-C(5))-methyltransferase (FADH(2)-oxidizing) TrmFO [Sulfidibacter corallicola]|uniref:Methylenetetrahydrofolate--tRNA-(uracil-5-)-methyltransferase TrmFO n=1 Tax=Sulfidibacter corallicola TaxID=2818388 RepID=A0A8A4TU06_SULCO|nr:methylenetetrahydrofolate--tRNA-(uracil(54)-C(5))-methyltransferase (FADH(2)-oxidizing) TrmFO [Sulfidibacter corallicola]QTD52953.1 methylenetetrahydrofolate--tRNA-(uracil(54)-C(5))-methyltransferase (FADH(2)-oxidizing) TrmFO [Sulfidibacter corallicola]